VVKKREEEANPNRLSGLDIIGYKPLLIREPFRLQEDIRMQTEF
jgi:hypothetical protein